MARRMLIDTTHPEETRVVVLNGTKLEEFDFETSTKKQIKGNIYLAKVTRVEPSLQAAFVEYGGNRHGFLAFSEIHPDYYRIPVSDREALDAEIHGEDEPGEPEPAEPEQPDQPDEEPGGGEQPDELPAQAATDGLRVPQIQGDGTDETESRPEPAPEASAGDPLESGDEGGADIVAEAQAGELVAETDRAPDSHAPDEPVVPLETVGGDDIEEVQARPKIRHYRNYKIQEVIKRRQILLVQVTKEERGSKGAAITTYLSLAGRYCVLMPNAGRGGGVSRKITSTADRRRLKELMDELEVPDGMGIIVRTAGSERSKTEIKRDYDYLLRLWDDIRELTLKSSAPALIYEEGSLIKRAIRDLYTLDIDEILVEGETGYRTAKDFMRMLMPSHAARVKPYRDPSIPLFNRYQIDAQIDQIHNPVVQLKSGGYIVINPTEALVSIDVNSGRATRERNIEETATKTNLEAADEIGRQLRLRDLAGLVVIDFIDMEESRNQRAVENRLKDAMKSDRARIQLGRISLFGLLELSRQRLRSSLIEASTQTCPHCNGTGTIRSTESTALVVLRALEDEGIRRRTAEASIFVPTQIALYLLNQKREALIAIEHRYGLRVTVGQDDSLIPPAYRLDRVRSLTPEDLLKLPSPVAPAVEPEPEDEIEAETVTAEAAEPAQGPAGEDRPRRKRRRRKRRRDGTMEPEETAESGETEEFDETAETTQDAAEEAEPAPLPPGPAADAVPGETGEARRRRRGRRGGRRHRRDEDLPASAPADTAMDFIDGTPSPFDFARDGRPQLFGDPDEPRAPAPAPAEPGTVVEATPAGAPEPAPVEPAAVAVASEPDTESAPAKRRRAPRKPRAEAAAAATPDEPPAPADPDEPAAPAAKPKRTRARKPAAEPVAEAPAAAETIEPVAAEPAPADTLQIAPEEDGVGVAEVAVVETPADLADDPAPDDGRPRRSGWWRRLLPAG